MDTYRVLVAILTKRGGYQIILLDFVKQDDLIIAISNNSEMVFVLDTIREVREYIEENKEDIDFVLSDKIGLTKDFIFISKSLQKKEQSRIFSSYLDSYSAIQKDIYSKPSAPRAGEVFQQDANTGEYTFFFENMNYKTLAMIFSIDIVIKAKGKQIIREMS